MAYVPCFRIFVSIEFLDKGYEFDAAFRNAIKLTKEDKKAVLLYSEVMSMDKPYRIGTMSSDKETVRTLGAKLDKKEKEAKISQKTADYYFQIIEEAKALEV